MGFEWQACRSAMRDAITVDHHRARGVKSQDLSRKTPDISVIYCQDFSAIQ
jgi:hypothetical protein